MANAWQGTPEGDRLARERTIRSIERIFAAIPQQEALESLTNGCVGVSVPNYVVRKAKGYAAFDKAKAKYSPIWMKCIDRQSEAWIFVEKFADGLIEISGSFGDLATNVKIFDEFLPIEGFNRQCFELLSFLVGGTRDDVLMDAMNPSRITNCFDKPRSPAPAPRSPDEIPPHPAAAPSE